MWLKRREGMRRQAHMLGHLRTPTVKAGGGPVLDVPVHPTPQKAGGEQTKGATDPG